MNGIMVKFLISWIMCGVIGPTTSIPLKEERVYGNFKTKIKRSPDNNFSLFGFELRTPAVQNLFTKSKEFGDSFPPVNFLYQNRNNHENDPLNGNVNRPKYGIIDTGSPIEDRHSIQNSKIQQDNLKKVEIKTEDDKKSKENTTIVSTEFGDNLHPKTEPVIHEESEIDYVDKKTLDTIFKDTKDNTIDNISTTLDTSTELTTETGNYESTTIDELLRIPAPVVASLLG